MSDSLSSKVSLSEEESETCSTGPLVFDATTTSIGWEDVGVSVTFGVNVMASVDFDAGSEAEGTGFAAGLLGLTSRSIDLRMNEGLKTLQGPMEERKTQNLPKTKSQVDAVMFKDLAPRRSIDHPKFGVDCDGNNEIFQISRAASQVFKYVDHPLITHTHIR